MGGNFLKFIIIMLIELLFFTDITGCHKNVCVEHRFIVSGSCIWLSSIAPVKQNERSALRSFCLMGYDGLLDPACLK